jgi:ubiquinone/menaquinone biosynthesis C-methylase UbiE
VGDERGGEPTWSGIARWYDELVEHGSGPHDTAVLCLLDLMPPVAGATVLDVGCGQGLATRAVAQAGARHVVGVDASAEMIALAREHTAPGGGHGARTRVEYRVDDAQTLATIADATFDGVTCQLALMDIPDLDATLRAVHRVLEPNGWFVLVIGHPCFLAPNATPVELPDGRRAVVVSEYLEETFWRSSNPNGVRRVGNHHRPLSTYLNAIVRAGFALDAVREPPASPLLFEQQPLYDTVPIFFAARVRRPG